MFWGTYNFQDLWNISEITLFLQCTYYLLLGRFIASDKYHSTTMINKLLKFCSGLASNVVHIKVYYYYTRGLLKLKLSKYLNWYVVSQLNVVQIPCLFLPHIQTLQSLAKIIPGLHFSTVSLTTAKKNVYIFFVTNYNDII